MAIFWRVEDNRGRGPYGGTKLLQDRFEWSTSKHQDMLHPGPIQDWGLERATLIVTTPGACFGFETIGQLKAWFTKDELRALKKLGFRPRRIVGQGLAFSTKQAVFVRKYPR